MGNIIQLHGDPHQQTQQLLPWFVNGTLDPAEARLVEEHLESCAECAADLARDRKFAGVFCALGDPAPGEWATLRDRAVATRERSARTLWQRLKPWSGTLAPGGLALIAASQILLVGLTVTTYHLLSAPAQPVYHTLSTAGSTLQPQGNIVVIFRPDVTEQAMRATLQTLDARIVDGPTSATAYVLAVPAAKRDLALGYLRARPDIVLAQPIDGASLP